MTAREAAWEAFHAAPHDETPCRQAFDAGWEAAAGRARQLLAAASLDRKWSADLHAGGKRQAEALGYLFQEAS